MPKRSKAQKLADSAAARQLDEVELDVALNAALRGDFEVAESRLNLGAKRAEGCSLKPMNLKRSWRNTDWLFRRRKSEKRSDF